MEDNTHTHTHREDSKEDEKTTLCNSQPRRARNIARTTIYTGLGGRVADARHEEIKGENDKKQRLQHNSMSPFP